MGTMKYKILNTED